ncbi:hypothetical protein F5144DRAFT_611678 [Chaetomium tenue]|uniref:Uncharacterized protein n=1 Tax=Chaetomium tenue TaxID=1854479 RepID=A0ACB7PDY8_9PEZI|nr:hypothetical protein F5144DRAFT_611678 [Chaetomium globosum]
MSPTNTFKPSPASESYACYSSNNTILVLSTGHVDLGELTFAEDTALIYAESVTISKDVSAPGKSLGIFCSQLNVVGPSQSVDLAGRGGEDMSTSPKGDGKPGGDGQQGGNMWLYVENTNNSPFELNIIANGGNAGRGGDTLDEKGIGGNGGNGGNAGSISIAYGTAAGDLLLSLRELKDYTWPQKAASILRSFIPGCESLPPGNVNPVRVEALKDEAELHLGYHTSMTRLVRLLETLEFASSSDTALVDSCRRAIGTMLKSDEFPVSVSPSNILATDSLSASIVKWMDEGGEERKQEILEQIRLLTQTVNDTSDDSGFSTKLQGVTGDLRAVTIRLATLTSRQIASSTGGRGGAGGVGLHSDSKTGQPGKKGEDGSRTSTALSLDRNAEYLKLDQVCVFPEQCQMLLNEADNLFFVNTPDSRSKAATLYTRLVQRLSFVPKLAQQPDCSLSTAYSHMESNLKLTVAALPQLKSVLSQASSRRLRILAGQDMFGHDPSWVPRLSIKVYSQRAEVLLPLLKEAEDIASGYQQALKDDAKVGDYLRRSLKAGKENEEKIQSRISSQCGSDGVISVAALQIKQVTYELEKVKREIELALQVDVWKMLDALTLLVVSRSLSDLSDFAKTAKKELTTIEDETGEKFEKANIIEKFVSCSDTLKSLEEALDLGNDGKIKLEDPGGIKVVAAIDSVKALVKQFKAAIPDHAKSLEKLLDDYVSTVLRRNSAVLSYNGAVQVVGEAVAELAYYREQNPKLGSELLNLNPQIPIIFFWMTRLRDTLRLDVMQQLNYQGRAICFWGPRSPLSFAESGPLQGYSHLRANQQSLEREFQKCLETFASSTWSVWPSKRQDPGLRYQLSDTEVQRLLQNPRMDSNGKRVYETAVTFPPITGNQTFAGMANIRLNQVRVWLPGARRSPEAGGSRQLLQISICHLGHETLWGPNRTSYDFVHEPVDLQFTYDTAGIDTIASCTTNVVFGRQAIERDYTGGGEVTESTVAPVGPLAEWRIEVREGDNDGLDLTKVTGVWMEFCGRNMPFQGPGDEVEGA